MKRYLFILFLSIFLLSTPLPVSLAQETSPEPSFAPLCESGQSKEECAIEKLNQGMLPEVVAEETNDSVIASWLTSIGQTVSAVVSFFTGANNLQDSYLPNLDDVSESTPSANTGLSNTLAGPEGYYGATLPQELPEGFSKPEGDGLQIGPVKLPIFSSINQEEKYYEHSYFPEEYCDQDGQCERICPITGQCNN